jgi:hypothetical protein
MVTVVKIVYKLSEKAFGRNNMVAVCSTGSIKPDAMNLYAAEMSGKYHR